MSEFGHYGVRAPGGGFMDTWGAGPFEIEVAGKRHRFEDSDRFGPLKLDRRDTPAEQQWGERNPFWAAHRLWREQGRQLAEDGVTCRWSEARPTLVRHIAGKHYALVVEGEEGGLTLDVATPAGERALAAHVARLPTEKRQP